MTERRKQADRRAETKAAIMSSAMRLFGEKGYNDTSLEDIAKDCGISVAPIYHYHKNKKSLFMAVNEAMEERILQDSDDNSDDASRILNNWQSFLEMCLDPNFRRIVLVDGPNVLGRERMYQSKVSERTLERMRKRFNADGSENYKAELLGRMIMGALAEAGLFVGNAEKPELAIKDAEELVGGLIAVLAAMKEQEK